MLSVIHFKVVIILINSLYCFKQISCSEWVSYFLLYNTQLHNTIPIHLLIYMAQLEHQCLRGASYIKLAKFTSNYDQYTNILIKK